MKSRHTNKKLKSPLDILRSIIIVPYYYIPKCPNCGSGKTGRYIKMGDDYQTRWSIIQSLKYGELVEPVPEVLHNNVFCATCGYEWNEYVASKWVNLNYINKEKEKRETNVMLKQKIEEHNNIEKENLKKKNIVGRTMSKYIGHL